MDLFHHQFMTCVKTQSDITTDIIDDFKSKIAKYLKLDMFKKLDEFIHFYTLCKNMLIQTLKYFLKRLKDIDELKYIHREIVLNIYDMMVVRKQIHFARIVKTIIPFFNSRDEDSHIFKLYRIVYGFYILLSGIYNHYNIHFKRFLGFSDFKPTINIYYYIMDEISSSYSNFLVNGNSLSSASASASASVPVPVVESTSVITAEVVSVVESSSQLEFTCSICYDNICVHPSVLTTCGHLFCNECITEWLKTKAVCPMCNKTTSSSNILKIYPS